MRVPMMLAAVAVLLSGCATTPEMAASRAKRIASGQAELAEAIKGRVTGKPVDCIPLTLMQSTRIIDGTAIIYKASSNVMYVNRPRSGAESLDNSDILVSSPTGSQLCSIDIVHLVDRASHFQTGFVGLGEFVPYRRER